MDCGVTIGAPQCKFICTAVRFLRDFGSVFTGFQSGNDAAPAGSQAPC